MNRATSLLATALVLVLGTEALAKKGRLKQSDIYWIARVIYGEARGESYKGQCLVGWSMLFRAAADLPEFGGSDFKAVATKYDPKKDRWQYDGVKVAVKDQRAWETATAVAQDVLMGRCLPPKPVMYFCDKNTRGACWWHNKDTVYVFTEGTHQFYTDRRYPGRQRVATSN